MKLMDYLKDKILDILINLFVIFLAIILLIIFSVNVVLIITISFLFVFSFLFILLHDYYKRKNFYNNLFKSLDSLDKKYYITELIKKPNFIDGSLYVDSLYEINKSFIEEINNYKFSNEEFKEYIELWCHEIKTPIATSKMISYNNKNEVTTSIDEELSKIEYFIEQVLFYAKVGNVSNDYIVIETNLKEIIENVIKRNKKDILSKKIKIYMFQDDIIINTDSKWLEFIINQIVTNSIKYCNNQDNILEFIVNKNKNNTILSIKDSGIGIEKAEVDKVFDKGFTGSNGRKKYNSTGIGLYLVKKLCEKLGYNVYIKSVVNQGTIISIVFPSNSMIKDIK